MHKWLRLSWLVVVLDQISKYGAVSMLRPQEFIALAPGLNFTLVYNPGASFGMLSEAGGWQRWLFVGIAILISVYLYSWLIRLGSAATWTAAGIALIIGGAIGNLVDRTWRGEVVDFIDVYYGVYHWPTFNLADTAIVLGAIAIIVQAMFVAEEKS